MIQGMMSQETLRMVYFAYVHLIKSYGIIFGGIVIYLHSFDPRKGYCPLDIEHVIISIHNTM